VELESAKKIFLNIADGTQKHSALLKDICEAVAKPKRKTKSKAKKLDEVFDVSYSIYKESVYLDGGAKIFVLEFFGFWPVVRCFSRCWRCRCGVWLFFCCGGSFAGVDCCN
jgi:hypothetical protein